MVPPSVASNRNLFNADALRQYRKNLATAKSINTNLSKDKSNMVAGGRFNAQIRLEFIFYILYTINYNLYHIYYRL